MNFKVYLFLFCSFLFSTVLFSETYHTIAINGTNAGWTADEAFAEFSLDENSNPWFVHAPDAALLCQGRYLGYQKVKQDTSFYFDNLLNFFSKT